MPACADFLAYLDSPEVQKKLVSTANVGLPANPAAADALTLPAERQILQLRLRKHCCHRSGRGLEFRIRSNGNFDCLRHRPDLESEVQPCLLADS